MALERSRGNGTAERVIRVMQTFADLPGDTHTLKTIADATGFDAAVVHRILTTTVALGWTERLGHGIYRLGSSAATTGMWAMAGMYSRLDPHQVLLDLQRSCGGMVLMYSLAPFGARRVCSDYALGQHAFEDFGMTADDMFTTGAFLRVGASGRTMLAYVPDDVRETALAQPIPPTAGPGALDNQAILDSLPAIRSNGYTIGRQECLTGWDSVAAPALWDDTILGVVLLLKPLHDIPTDITDYIEPVRLAAKLITVAAHSTYTVA
ncbi:transcriptional regulator, IclR family [Actinobacteria bacterium OK074]|nr:transcriptional regulator, IclR family [Actinobacteria bacterium OK074]